MDRYWLITWTCYGTWLPGDQRGFVGNFREDDGTHVNFNTPDTPYAADLPRLEYWIREQMKGDPISVGKPEADALIAQFRPTAHVRAWSLEAASVMRNHVHLVVGVTGDPEPELVLELFKSWATRAIKKVREVPINRKFWTVNGSKRKLPDEAAVKAAVVYVTKKQPDPLATWWGDHWAELLDGKCN
jgi:REP element-mobilizing transposase RayT